MAESAAAEQRRALEFANTQADRAAAMEAARLAAQMPSGVPFDATPGPGLMDPYQVPVAPEARAPSEKYAGEFAQPISRDQFIQLLPEMARMEQAEGLPNNFLETMSMLESSGGTNMGTGEKYIGMFQIGPEVARDFGVTPDQLRDPRVNAQVAAKLAGRNARQLRELLGREPQPWELYLAHQQGIGGASALLRTPEANVVDALAAAYGGNRARAEQAVVQNGGNPNMTAGQFAALWARKFGAAAPGPKGVTGGPGTPAGMEVPPVNRSRAEFGLGAVAPAVPPETVSPRGDLPAGLLDVAVPPPAAPPAAAAPGVQVAPAAQPTQPSLAPIAARDLIPGVSAADYAGLNDGTGSLASSVARTRAGEVPRTPDTGMYIVEPMRITNERRLLAAQRDEIQRQLQIASMTRDFATIRELRNQAAQNQLADNLMGAMEVIANMQQGSDEQFAQALSGLTQGRQRLQPRSDGAFNIYYDGQLVGEGIPRDQIIASLRMQYDQQYQALAAAQAKAAGERDLKILESELKTREQLSVEEAKMLANIAAKRDELAIKNANPEYNITVGDDGTVTAVPKTGNPTPIRFTPEVILDPDGEPVLDGQGNPRYKLVPMPVQGR
jgi:hypothetical protein